MASSSSLRRFHLEGVRDTGRVIGDGAYAKSHRGRSLRGRQGAGVPGAEMCGEKALRRVVRERLARVESRHAAEVRSCSLITRRARSLLLACCSFTPFFLHV